MKTKKSILAVASFLMVAAFSSSAFADDQWLGDRGTNWLDHIKSTKSRAEVMAELEQARKAGTLYVGNGVSYPREPAMTSGGTYSSGRSRAEVHSEAIQANRNPRGPLNEIYFGGN